VRDIAHIGYDMAEALQYVHHRGVVHRDIKPSNILMVDYRDDGTRPRAKLTDFGIARTGASRSLEEGATTGTAAYISPEQVRRAEIGPASDIYSLGLVLLECFTGQLAYPGEPVNAALARLEASPSMPDSIPDEWREILSAMTAARPARRPTAAQLVETMRRLIVAETERRTIPFPSENPDLNLGRISRMTARVLDVPIAIIAIGDRLWCTPWLTENTRLDARKLISEEGANEHGLQFWAGMPIEGRDGAIRGVLCALSFENRTMSKDDETTLRDLAAMAANEIDSQRSSLSA
jgi:serine/threonine protein kinase